MQTRIELTDIKDVDNENIVKVHFNVKFHEEEIIPPTPSISKIDPPISFVENKPETEEDRTVRVHLPKEPAKEILPVDTKNIRNIPFTKEPICKTFCDSMEESYGTCLEYAFCNTKECIKKRGKPADGCASEVMHEISTSCYAYDCDFCTIVFLIPLIPPALVADVSRCTLGLIGGSLLGPLSFFRKKVSECTRDQNNEDCKSSYDFSHK